MLMISGWHICRKISIATSFVLGGVIATSANCAWGQIASDNSLGSESSQITSPIPGTFQIDGGATRGTNLFHSFNQFSVPTNNTAHFNNALNIQNIISRVTGGSISNIDGLIKANGGANLFLLNPSGIIFGPNAKLNIGGSFLASTASSLKFADGTHFSATAAQNTPLLTVNVPIGLQFGGNPGSIQNQSQVRDSSGQIVGLQVKPGRSLGLVGGNVNLDGGSLQAANSRVELAGVAGAGTVGLEVNDNNFSLSFPSNLERADVLLTNAAKVDVADRGSGSVGITARNLNIERESRISAGIKPNLTADGSVPGNITLNATGAMRINQESLVENGVASGARGKGGNINANANLFELTGGGRLSTRTLGMMRSDAGDINIKAGDIYINNPPYQVSLEDKPALDASTYKNGSIDGGIGHTGNISLEANGSISLIGNGSDLENKVISTYNSRRTDGLGSGNISLKAKGSISLSNAYLVSTSFSNRGGAGNILLQGDASVSLVNNSSLVATTYGQGSTGNITLKSQGPVSVQSSLIAADVRNEAPKSDVGNISISGRSVFITDGSEVTTETDEGGKFGGNIQVNAKDIVEISGIHPLFSDPKLFKKSRPQSVYSTLVTTTRKKANGPAGDIIVNTDTLRVADGASLQAGTQGDHSGGNISVNARIVELTGGGKLLSTASGTGNAGNINLNVSKRITISGSNTSFKEIFNEVSRRFREGIQSAQRRLGPSDTAASGIYASTDENSTAQGGNLKITTSELVVKDEAQVTVSSKGGRQAGNLEITARSIKLDNGKLIGETNSGDGGNITLNLKDLLLLRRKSQISTSAGKDRGGGDGGNININAPDSFIVAAPLENSDITANAYTGQGGRVTINAHGIFGMVPRGRQDLERLSPNDLDPRKIPTNDITAISQQNPSLSGTVTLNTPDVDPSQGLVELPAVPVNVEVAQGCQPGGKQASVAFYNTGRGGIAPNPYEPLSSSHIWEDVPSPSTSASSATAPNKIVEAKGWILNAKGEVTLVAEVPATASQGRCRLH